jgi:hypothetical protein
MDRAPTNEKALAILLPMMSMMTETIIPMSIIVWLKLWEYEEPR